MKSPSQYIDDLKTKETSIAPLVIFRILFGLLMAFGAIRFIFSGWIEKLYLEPDFFFKFFGFEWVHVPQSAWLLYGLHLLIATSAIGIALGWKYRWAAILFFLSFSYAEMMDATNYLNHYYLVILVAFLMIFLPAHRSFSIDAFINKSIRQNNVPRLYLAVLQWQVGLVYVFAGLAKVNYDWLVHAMPLAVWLPARTDIPGLGLLFEQPWAPFLMSWAGAFYDLFIVFLLTSKRWWKAGYLLVIIFHLMTKVLFNIGMFPYIMICFTTIFIPVVYHQRSLKFLRKLFGKIRSVTILTPPVNASIPKVAPISSRTKSLSLVFMFFIIIQLIAPLRHLLYSGSVHWNEEGYRWSWRVMLLEKAGTAFFTVEDLRSGRKFEVENDLFLTAYQEKQMAFQPDFILQFAHHLNQHYMKKLGSEDLRITVRSRVSLNGRKSQTLIDPHTDLTKIHNTWLKKKWILPYEPQITAL
ncbi:HTTM domain-containing protein [Membranicola marinus]|uniref:HTTM domain-containing protein n=1 Tax=Membranihabitans marinus TaxID=1227546 RepID=A0A953L9W8_9BACT|nr:HTTM domain-containing protein [Membranihabitans marinus]MBY5958078.1 HTTM domain-containing protein [Membranihabitans marinus]